MADDFQAEVCGGSWWTSPITTTFNSSSFSGTYGGCWQNSILMNMKTTSTEDSSGCYTTAVLPDSAFPIMGSSPSTTTNWYQPLLDDGRTTAESCSQTLPEILNNLSDFGMDQEQTSSFMTNSGDCTQNFVSTSYGYPSSLLQTIFDGTSSSPPPPAPPQQLLYDLQQISEGLQLTNKAFFCNASALDINNNRADVYNSSKKIKSRNEEISSESTYKRPRMETPSPLPTFKVRKEKLGDRVTALQQLVSPFGKTDTASVLHEAIEYIKLLHDQINVLSDPYMKIGATMQVQQINGKGEDKKEGAKQQADLRSRGLCLVPVSYTFPVATQTAPDYWTSCFKNRFK